MKHIPPETLTSVPPADARDYLLTLIAVGDYSTLADIRKTLQKPKGYSLNSNLSYYTPAVGNALLPELDRFAGNPAKDLFFSAASVRVKTSTLYQRITQGWKWIQECHPDKATRDRMRELYSLTRISRESGGVRLRHLGADSLLGKVSLETRPDSRKLDWSESLSQFLDEALPGEILALQELVLSAEDQDFIRTQVENSHGFAVAELCRSSLKVTCS